MNRFNLLIGTLLCSSVIIFSCSTDRFTNIVPDNPLDEYGEDWPGSDEVLTGDDLDSAKTVLDSLFESFEEEPEEITIGKYVLTTKKDTGKCEMDSLIIARTSRGTTITIPTENIYLFNNGDLPSEEFVKVKVKELYQAGEMILNNAIPQDYQGGILKSGGEFEVGLYYGDHSFNMFPEGFYQIKTASGLPNVADDMIEYYGTKSPAKLVDWRPDPTPMIDSNTVDSILTDFTNELYVLTPDDFGWVNIDQLVKAGEQSEIVRFTSPEWKNPELIRLYIVLPEINSISRIWPEDGQLHSVRLPLAYKFHYIAVSVNDDRNIIMSSQANLTVGINNDISLDFKELTEEEAKDFLHGFRF